MTTLKKKLAEIERFNKYDVMRDDKCLDWYSADEIDDVISGMIIKRYAVFIFSGYYPAGGWNDFYGFFDSIEEAKKISVGSDYDGGEPLFRKPPGANNPKYGNEYAQIVDLESGVVVLEGNGGRWEAAQ